ncbi:S8 family peptidase [Methylobacterium sp. Leaf118]|uniref:S8 family peptidase n=1 Tax=Methylobacterium sp. Leaf118 TaxID=2876562 RepID=UPI001E4E95ED|nr:S8 family serine peptidase [Methylobacterium sp. Leaf118]
MDRVLVRLPSVAMKLDLLHGAVLEDRGPRHVKPAFSQLDTVSLELDDTERKRLEGMGARVYDNVEFKITPASGSPDPSSSRWSATAGGSQSTLSLADVTDHIKAPGAWTVTRGKGATIVVVDTGIDAGLREIAPARRSAIDLDTTHKGQHWIDSVGHGSMCAAIAAGARRPDGRYDGVAPEATILSARTTFMSDDLFEIYDELVRTRAQGLLPGPLVVSNSYALYVCHAPQVLPKDHPFIGSILALIEAGAFVCFAAGNNHHDVLCKHDPAACGPNTIWGPNSHDRVVSIGTVNREETNRDPSTPHVNSSRGPGEWAQDRLKPDCVAPTYGEVPWGAGYQTMDWWGTSGACPQVAGLAALLFSVAPRLSPQAVADIILKTCVRLPDSRTCVGHGMIDCEAALQAALSAPTV